jgi:hypothetical protein
MYWSVCAGEEASGRTKSDRTENMAIVTLNMMSLQPFIDNNKARMNQFLNALCEVPDFYDSLEICKSFFDKAMYWSVCAGEEASGRTKSDRTENMAPGYPCPYFF